MLHVHIRPPRSKSSRGSTGREQDFEAVLKQAVERRGDRSSTFNSGTMRSEGRARETPACANALRQAGPVGAKKWRNPRLPCAGGRISSRL